MPKKSGKVFSMPQLNRALADKVVRHMQVSSLTQIEVAGRGGPSTTTLTKITKGEGPISSRVLRQLKKTPTLRREWGSTGVRSP